LQGSPTIARHALDCANSRGGRRYISCGARAKCQRLDAGEPGGLDSARLGFQRINAIKQLAAHLASAFAGDDKRNVGERPKPHVAAAAADLIAEDPGSRAGRGDAQVEPAAVGVEPRRISGCDGARS
jgi:hypothetical protein